MAAIDQSQIVAPAVKKRNRNVLEPNFTDLRNAGTSQKQNYYLGTKGIEDTVEKAVARSNKAKAASIASIISREPVHFASLGLKNKGKSPIYEDIDRKPEFYDERRIAIKHVYEAVFNSPPEEEWHNLKLVGAISNILHIPPNSHSRVKQVLQKVLENDASSSSETVQKKPRVNKKPVQKGSDNAAPVNHGSAQAGIVRDWASLNTDSGP